MSIRVLIVDDHPAIRSTMMDILKSEGLEVEIAENGTTALKIYSDKVFEFVLMDMQMPDIKGIDTYRQILAIPKKHAEFIFISAFATPELEKKTKELGCLAFLHKPIRAEQVIKLIRSKSLLSVLVYISNEGLRNKVIKNLQNENCNLEIASDFDDTLILIRQIDYNYLIIDEDSFSSEQDRIKSTLHLSGSHTELILINEDQSTDILKEQILQI